MKHPKTISELMGREWFEDYCDNHYYESYRTEAKKPGSYADNLGHIREAIIAKALGLLYKLPEPEPYYDRYDGDKLKYKHIECKSHLNSDLYTMPDVFAALPEITGEDLAKLTANRSNAKRFYTSMWGYDQTNITTAEHIGTFNGLDVVIEGGYSCCEINLVKIKDNTSGYKGGKQFKIGCMHFYGEPITGEEANHEYETKDDWAAHGYAR